MSAQSPQSNGGESSREGGASPRPARSRRRAARARGGSARGSIKVVFGLLTVATVGSLLALGSVHVASVLSVMPVAIAAGTLALFGERERESRLPPPAGVLIALAVYSAVQAMPLPLGVVRLLDAHSAGIWETALQPFGEPIRAASLSLDPGASMVEALKWLGYAAVFVAGASVARRADLHRIITLVFGAAVLAAAITLGHRLFDAQSFFGIYRPVYAGSKFAASPLVNPNNLAGYLNLGAFCGIGLMVSRRAMLPPWLLGLGIAVIVGLSAVCGSRAGLASLALGAVVLLIGLSVTRFEGRTTPPVVKWLAAASLGGGLMLFVLGADVGVWKALFEEGTEKIALISWTRGLVLDHPWFGVGRGAFETAFSAYRGDQGHHVYQFAENFVMQWCSEWGIPVSIAALASLAWLLRPGRLGLLRSPLAFATGVGVLTLLLQNLLDLGLEVASISIPLFMLLGALWAGGTATQPVSSSRPSWLGQPGVAFAGAGGALWFCALLMGRHTALSDRLAIADAYRALPVRESQGASARAALHEQLLQATRRHPADPFLPLIGALDARAAGKNPLPWVSRGIERDPMGGRPYLLLAEVLAKRGAKDQALLSIRQAVEREQGLTRVGVPLALQVSRDPGKLGRAAPEGTAGAFMLTELAARAEARSIRRELLEAAIAKVPNLAHPRLILAEDLLQALETKAPPCADAGVEDCRARVATLAKEIARGDRSQEGPTIFEARLLAQSGDLDRAVAYLATRCPSYRPGLECLRWQVTLGQKSRNRVAVAKAASSYLAAACEDDAGCNGAATWLGVMFESLGEDAQALKMFERAARHLESEHAWSNVARVASRLGLVGEAKRARDRAGRAPAVPAAATAPSESQGDLLPRVVDDEDGG
jgi:tetratricopeptide (TPR) repeat protein